MTDEQFGKLKHEGIELAEDTIEENKHWQEVRERAAIAAMQGLLSCSKSFGSVKDYIETAIDYANKIVEELKKK